MSSFKNKILWVGVGAATAIGVYVLVKMMKDSEQAPPPPPQQPHKQEDLPKQIRELKQKFKLDDIKLDDLKEILDVSNQLSNQAITSFNLSFREERRKYINTDFKAYIKCITNAISSLEQMSCVQQQRVLDSLSLSAEKYQEACMKNEAIFDYQTVNQERKVRELSINQIRNVFNFQKKYLQEHGTQLQDKIKSALPSWDPKAKSMVTTYVSYALADIIYAEFGFEQDQIQQATNKYRIELSKQMESVKQLLVPLLKRVGSTGSGGNLYNPLGFQGIQLEQSESDRVDKIGVEQSFEKIDPALKQMENMQGDPEIMEKIMELMHEK